MRVVVLGAGGNFGARIVRALQHDADIEIVAASRRAAPVPGAAGVRTVALDVTAAEFPVRIAALAPGLVIHSVGPFQGQSYRVAKAALAAGAHYLDLADGREFVTEFPTALRTQATAARRVAISGVSTLPALSAAVVQSLRADLQAIESIEIAIAPGQRAPRGAATLAAVFSYLGRPIRVWSEGRWQTAWGWMDLTRIAFAFGKRWGAACDVPDLTLLPALHADVKSVRFHAALEFGVQHLLLWACAGVRRIGLPLPVEDWANAMNRYAGCFDSIAGAVGGMRVSVVGRRANESAVRRTWQLIAPALHGPEIPTLPSILLTRQLARGQLQASGAFACMGFLSLADFEPEFRRWHITTRVEEQAV